jgi:hypothetical protein
MGKLILPNRRLERPASFRPNIKPAWPVEIDWNHPMTRKLEAYLYAIPGGVIDLVSGRLMTKVNSPSTDIYTPHSGIASSTNGADSYYLLEDMPSKTLYFDDGMALAYSFNSDASQSDKRPVSFSDGSTFYSIECETSQHQGFLRSNAGDFTLNSSSGSNLIGDNYGIYQSNVSANRMTLNINGVSTDNTVSVSGSSFTYDRCAIGCLFRSSAGNFFNGQVPAVCLFSRELTSAEVNVYNNTKGASIYQMLIPA